MAGKNCASIACGRTATHKLSYSFPEARDVTHTELVCQTCGEGYVNRPSLKATLHTIPVKSSRKRNKLFIWEGVLSDYTSGMAVVLAPTLEAALEIMQSQVGEYHMSELRSTEPTVIDSLVGVPQAWHVTGGG